MGVLTSGDFQLSHIALWNMWHFYEYFFGEDYTCICICSCFTKLQKVLFHLSYIWFLGCFFYIIGNVILQQVVLKKLVVKLNTNWIFKKIPHSKDKASLNQCGRYHRYHKNLDLIDLMINDLLSLNSPGFFFFFFRWFYFLFLYF